MSTTAKFGVILVIILAIIVIGGIWYGGSDYDKTRDTETTSLGNTQTEVTPSPAINSPISNMSPADDKSNGALEKDTAAIEAELSSLNSDGTTIDGDITNINQ